MFLGIDATSHLIFEGTSPSEGRGLWPLPVVTPAAIGAKMPGELTESLPSDNTPLLETVRCVFREDFFDPVTRIRRGRFYRRDANPLHLPWEASPHPALNLQGLAAYSDLIVAHRQDLNIHTGRLRIQDLLTFQSFLVRYELRGVSPNHVLVVLGTKQSSTRWSLIDIEPISTGEELVTLKARNLFGTLPEFRGEAIVDDNDRTTISEAIERLADTIYRAGPESIVDGARDVASAMVLTALRQEGVTLKSNELDLGPATKKFAEHPELGKLNIVVNAAQIIGRLHPRRKPSEQQRRSELHALRDKDADLAVLCVGTMLRDLGWAEWL